MAGKGQPDRIGVRRDRYLEDQDTAFVTPSAFLAGAAGALYGLNYATLVPNKFDFNTSILILVYVVLGGLGNMTGTMISTVILVLLPELLCSMQDYRMLIYAVVLILIMLVTNNECLKSRLKGFAARRAFQRVAQLTAFALADGAKNESHA